MNIFFFNFVILFKINNTIIYIYVYEMFARLMMSKQ